MLCLIGVIHTDCSYSSYCDECDKEYRQKDIMDQNISEVHSENLFTCQLWKFVTNDKERLEEHLNYLHERNEEIEDLTIITLYESLNSTAFNWLEYTFKSEYTEEFMKNKVGNHCLTAHSHPLTRKLWKRIRNHMALSSPWKHCKAWRKLSDWSLWI